jgi:uncharacterized protein (TIGR00369 family)
MSIEPRNPDFEAKVRDVMTRAAFVTDVGIVLTGIGPGWCETELAVLPRHTQQNGFVHAGVLATIGDHTAGAAAATLIGATEGVLTVEFKINLLRPANGTHLRCRAEILKAGRTLTIVESSVFARAAMAPTDDKLVAKLSVTLAVVQDASAAR